MSLQYVVAGLGKELKFNFSKVLLLVLQSPILQNVLLYLILLMGPTPSDLSH